MKNKTLSFFGAIFKILNIFIVLISFAGLVLLVLNEFDFAVDFEPLKFIYIVMYELILPFIYLFFGGTSSVTPNNIVSVGAVAALVTMVLSIVAIREASRATSYITYPNKKVSYIWTGVYSLFLAALYTLTLSLTGADYNNVGAFISANSTGMIATKTVILKGAVLSAIALSICIEMFICLLACRSKGQRKVREVTSKLSFYSNEYQEKETSSKVLTNAEEIDASKNDECAESTPQAKKLIERIMELNKMLESGEIDDVEFTRLRQIAIRRYKK